VLSFAQHEGKKRGGSTWWVLVAGEETKESLSTWLRAAAVHQSSESETVARETTQNARGGMQRKGLLGGGTRCSPAGPVGVVGRSERAPAVPHVAKGRSLSTSDQTPRLSYWVGLR